MASASTTAASTSPTSTDGTEAGPDDSIICHPPTPSTTEEALDTPRLEDVLNGNYEVEFTAAIIMDESIKNAATV